MWGTVRDFLHQKEDPNIHIHDDHDWKNMEDLLFDKRNYYLKEIIHNYEKTHQISVAVSRLQGLFNQLLVRRTSSQKTSILGLNSCRAQLRTESVEE